MDDNYQVCFTPSGRQFKGEFGDTVLQVAQDAGVAIRSLCGGYGQCHQCWIEVSEGEHSKFGVKCALCLMWGQSPKRCVWPLHFGDESREGARCDATNTHTFALKIKNAWHATPIKGLAINLG